MSEEWQSMLVAASRRDPYVEVRLERLEVLPDPQQRACGIAMIVIQDPDWRGKNLASSRLRELCQVADRYGVLLHLTPRTVPGKRGLSKTALTAWYRRRGFTSNVGPGRGRDLRVTDAMVRKPRGGLGG